MNIFYCFTICIWIGRDQFVAVMTDSHCPASTPGKVTMDVNGTVPRSVVNEIRIQFQNPMYLLGIGDGIGQYDEAIKHLMF